MSVPAEILPTVPDTAAKPIGAWSGAQMRMVYRFRASGRSADFFILAHAPALRRYPPCNLARPARFDQAISATSVQRILIIVIALLSNAIVNMTITANGDP